MRLTNLQNKLSQFLIDFGESRMQTAQSLSEKRASKYGDSSWQWHWTFWQERFWSKFTWFILRRL